MTRVQFLNSLYARLGALEKAQAEEWLVYYAEMLADRMEEGMTEEEAVASLEDIDTIAGRILREAGLPEDAGDRAGTPPAYPSPPPRPEGMGTRGYTPPRRRGISLNTVLWIVAGIAVLCAAGRLVYRLLPTGGSYAENSVVIIDQGTAEQVPDYGLEPDPEWYTFGGEPIPEGGWDFYVADEGEQTVFLPRPWDDSESAPPSGAVGQVTWGSDSGCTVAGWTTEHRSGFQLYDYSGELEKISVWWSAGSVTVRGWDYGEIAFEADGGGKTVPYRVRDGRLTVGSDGDGESRDLTLMVPAWWLEELEIQTESADVTLTGMTLDDLVIQTASGDVTFGDVSADDLEVTSGSGAVAGSFDYLYEGHVATASGNMDLTGNTMSEVSLESDSGNITLGLADETAYQTEVETGSGDIVLAMPEDMGFTLRWRTDSGTMERGPFHLTETGRGRYSCGDEYARIEAKTASGNLSLAVLEP